MTESQHEKRNLIHSGDLELEYFVFGDGFETVICLHGHGRSAFDFKFLENHKLKVISIHLPFHGASFFPVERIEKNPLTLDEFSMAFKVILDTENVSKFHLFAFSQGGRFSLAMLPKIPDLIETVTLISPDGMDNNSFYNWASRRKWARYLMYSWESEPIKLYHYGKIARSLRLMRPKVLSFVKEFTSSKKSFIRASRTWRCFRELRPNPKLIGKTIRINNIPFKIIMGKYDQVIRPQQAYSFEQNCGLSNSVIEIASGHNFFKESTINKFIPFLPFINGEK